MIADKYKILKSKMVLYVEDDLELQQHVLEVLSNFFESVLVASNGDEAYDIYLEYQNSIDILITDIDMPKTDGMVLSQYIRTHKRTLPIVIISAYTDTDYLLESINLNILAYITKPFTTQKTLTLLDKFLDHFGLHSQVVLAPDIELDYEQGYLFIEGEQILLTNKEKIFLKLLSEHAVVTFDMMYENMWDYSKSPSQNAVKSFIGKLKRKLPYDLFHNRRGEGYYFTPLPAE